MRKIAHIIRSRNCNTARASLEWASSGHAFQLARLVAINDVVGPGSQRLSYHIHLPASASGSLPEPGRDVTPARRTAQTLPAHGCPPHHLPYTF